MNIPLETRRTVRDTAVKRAGERVDRPQCLRRAPVPAYIRQKPERLLDQRAAGDTAICRHKPPDIIGLPRLAMQLNHVVCELAHEIVLGLVAEGVVDAIDALTSCPLQQRELVGDGIVYRGIETDHRRYRDVRVVADPGHHAHLIQGLEPRKVMARDAQHQHDGAVGFGTRPFQDGAGGCVEVDKVDAMKLCCGRIRLHFLRCRQADGGHELDYGLGRDGAGEVVLGCGCHLDSDGGCVTGWGGGELAGDVTIGSVAGE